MRVVATCVLVAFALIGSATAAHLEPCTSPEDYRLPDGRDYRGSVSRTVTGLVCQPWKDQYPHRHEVPIDAALGTAGAGNNYCRNIYPETNSGPWCFTMSDQVVRQACNVGARCSIATAPRVEPVIILPSGNSQESPVVMTLTSATLGADVYFTTDGTEPTEANSLLYRGPVTLTGDGIRQIRAFAAKDYMVPSSTSVKMYQLTRPAVNRPMVNPVPTEGQIFDLPVFVSINNTDATAPDAIIFYTTDSSAPDIMSPRYQGPFWLKTSAFVRTFAYANGRSPSTSTSVYFNINAPQAELAIVSPTIAPGTTLFGAVDLMFSTALTEPEYAITINGSAAMTLAQAQVAVNAAVDSRTSKSLRIERLGTTTLTISVADRKTRFSKPVTVSFLLKPLPSVALLPAPGEYHTPTAVTVTFASIGPFIGVPIVVLVNGQPSLPVFTIDSLGNYTVEAYATSSGGRGPLMRATYSLTPIYLQAPTIAPNPSDFPTGFTFVSPLVLTLPPQSVPATSYEITISSAAQGSSRTQLVPADGSSKVTLASATNNGAVDRYVAIIRTVPTDARNPFLVASNASRMEFRISPYGDRSTPFFMLNLPTDPTLFDCGGVEASINQALFLSTSAGANYGAQAVLQQCARRPAFRIINLPTTALQSYVRFIVNDLARPATSIIYKQVNNGQPNVGAVPMVFVDRPLFEASCTAVSATFFPNVDPAVPITDSVTPLQCVTQCRMMNNFTDVASVLLAFGGKCACLNTVDPPGVTLSPLDCNMACNANPAYNCGGRSSSLSTAVASQYGVINTTSGSAAALFPIVYGYSVLTQGILSTTSLFDVQLDTANLPSVGGNVKFVMDSQTCAALTTPYTFDQSGIIRSVLLRRPGYYRVCTALSVSTGTDDAGVFREVRSYGIVGLLNIVSGEDVPIIVTPGSGTFATPLSITVTCNASTAQLIITVDQQDAVTVPGPTYTFILRTLGTHVITTLAKTTAGAIGLPVTRSFIIVDPNALTPPPPIGSGNAAAFGVQGYSYMITTLHGIVVRLMLTNNNVWGTTQCAASRACSLYVLSATSTSCADVTTLNASGSVAWATLDRSATDSSAVETITPLDFATYDFNRKPLRVCLVAGNATAEVSSLSDAWQLSSAVQGKGICSTSSASMCQNNSNCSARITPNAKPLYLCICASAADNAQQSVFCTDPSIVPLGLRNATTWDGSQVAFLTPAPGPAPGQQGSWGSLLVLLLIFAVSTATLVYYKNEQKGDEPNVVPLPPLASVQPTKVVASSIDDGAAKA
jgi:hypothetical protein